MFWGFKLLSPRPFWLLYFAVFTVHSDLWIIAIALFKIIKLVYQVKADANARFSNYHIKWIHTYVWLYQVITGTEYLSPKPQWLHITNLWLFPIFCTVSFPRNLKWTNIIYLYWGYDGSFLLPGGYIITSNHGTVVPPNIYILYIGMHISTRLHQKLLGKCFVSGG